MQPRAITPLTAIDPYILNVGKMKTPPRKIAEMSVMKLGPGMRRHCSGLASMMEVTSISRFPSSASGMKKRPSSTSRTKFGWSQSG